MGLALTTPSGLTKSACNERKTELAKSGLLGDRDGIYLVHPSILLPFVKYVREAIIELSMMSKSERERDSKEVMLYEYIRS